MAEGLSLSPSNYKVSTLNPVYFILIQFFRYDLELHMVHKSLDVKAENKIVVVGVSYNIGEPDAFLSKVKEWWFLHTTFMDAHRVENKIRF